MSQRIPSGPARAESGRTPARARARPPPARDRVLPDVVGGAVYEPAHPVRARLGRERDNPRRRLPDVHGPRPGGGAPGRPQPPPPHGPPPPARGAAGGGE